jgi:acyl-CoA synthetase (AMP-forming)/AMP-acid ligase II
VHAGADPGADAVVEERRSLTRAELSLLADRLAHVLAGAGAGAGERVAWIMPNRAEVIAIAVAAQRLGAVLVPLGYRSTPGEVARMLAVARPAVILCDETTTAKLATSAAPVLDVDDPGFAAAMQRMPESPVRPRAGGPERLGAGASLLFTSGTTGTPKGALRTRGDPALGGAIADGFGFGRSTRYLASGPLYHSGPGTCALMALSRGGVVGLRPRFDPAAWLAFARKHQITASFITPSQLRWLVEEVEQGAVPPESLVNVVVSGEPFPAELKRRAVAALGTCLIDCYGCTELGPLTYMPAGELLSRPTSCGRPFAGVEIAPFAAGADQPLGPGQPGILRVRTPLAFDGYLGPDGSLARPGDWATVGDIGYLDPDGYLHLVDRADDLIISGGVNIFAAEVEAVLAGHPLVRRCAVLGLPDERWGQVVCAVVVADGPLTTDSLRTWMKGRIADDKRPRTLVLVPELPATGTGKLARAALPGLLGLRPPRNGSAAKAPGPDRRIRPAGSPSDRRS